MTKVILQIDPQFLVILRDVYFRTKINNFIRIMSKSLQGR